MSKATYLLFINTTPLRDDFLHYFAQFNIDILQQETLEIPPNTDLPAAILIHWSILNNQMNVIRTLYSTYPVPLIILHDSPDEELCINVLEAGADDFISTSIYPRELHARLTAISRRVAREQQSNSEGEIFIFSHWKLYPNSRRVFNSNNQQELLLSAGEYDLLYAFVQQPQQILNREDLSLITKNSDINPFDRRIDVQISRLRQKIEIDAKKPTLIKTIRNSGYLFATQVSKLKGH